MIIVPIALGLATVGAGLVAWRFLAPKHALVLYSDDPQDPSAERGEFRTSAETAARLPPPTPIAVRSAQDVLRAIEQAPSRLGVVVLVGHGTATKFFSPARYGIRVGSTSLPAWISAQDFARALAAKLAPGAIVSLAGCSAARSPREPSGWVIDTGWHGGADSLAGHMRDALFEAGASGEVRAHVVTGTTLLNPQGRTFYIDRRYVRRPGVHIMALAGRSQPREFGDYTGWNNYAQGRIAMGWMLGARIHDLVQA